MKTTAVGWEERGYDGGKKVKGRKRHLLVDTEGFVLSRPRSTAREGHGLRRHQVATVESGGAVPSPLSPVAGRRLQRRGQGRRVGTEKTLGWSVELVERPRKPAPEEVLMRWAREWVKEGVALDWQKFMPPEGLVVLPRRWVVERTIAWIDQNRRMSKDYERLCASGEALVYAAMIRLMTRRLARV